MYEASRSILCSHLVFSLMYWKGAYVNVQWAPWSPREGELSPTQTLNSLQTLQGRTASLTDSLMLIGLACLLVSTLNPWNESQGNSDRLWIVHLHQRCISALICCVVNIACLRKAADGNCASERACCGEWAAVTVLFHLLCYCAAGPSGCRICAPLSPILCLHVCVCVCKQRRVSLIFGGCLSPKK